MSYRTLLKTMGNREKPPSLKPARFRGRNRADAGKGICVECGKTESQENSFVCGECASKVSLTDIREEIDRIRNRVLKAN